MAGDFRGEIYQSVTLHRGTFSIDTENHGLIVNMPKE